MLSHPRVVHVRNPPTEMSVVSATRPTDREPSASTYTILKTSLDVTRHAGTYPHSISVIELKLNRLRRFRNGGDGRIAPEPT